MVYSGRLSTGCLTCRLRKVKCDETVPTCRRCAVYGRLCPGYPSAYAFRSENERLEFKFKGPRAPVSVAPRSTSRAVIAENQVIEFGAGVFQPTCIPRPLKPAAKELSLCYFMTSFIFICPEDIFQGHLDFLPGLYCDGREECQDLAIMSVAYLAAFNKWRSWNLFEQSRKYYGAAMKSLQNALRSPRSAKSDSTFAAALILALFVDMSNERKITANPHMHGIFQLLLFRGQKQLSTNLGRNLSGYALTQLCIEYMHSKDAKYQGLSEVLPWFEGFSILDRARVFSIRAIELCSQFRDIHTLLDDDTKDHQKLSKETEDRILKIYKAVEHSFLQLGEAKQLSKDSELYLDSKRRTPPELSALATSSLRNDKNQGTAVSIAVIRAGQVIFCWELMRCCERLNEFSTLSPSTTQSIPSFSLEITWLEEHHKQSIADIVSLISCAMKDFDISSDAHLPSVPLGLAGLGHLIIWPAYTVAQSPYSSPSQVSYSRQILQELGSSAISTAHGLLDVPLFNNTGLA